MKVLILSPYAALSPHFETELELAQRHADAGDEVTVASCWGELPGCEFNLTADPKQCHCCRSRRQAGWQMVEPAVHTAALCPAIPFPYESSLPTATADAAALKQWRPGDTDLGWGVLSTLISATCNPEPDLGRVRWLMRRLAASAERVYRSVAARLEQDRPDRVYLFNGRFAAQRAVLRACEQAGVDFYVHERGCDTSHFSLTHAAMPHSLQRVRAAIDDVWLRAASDPDRNALAAQWFIDRANRVERSWHSFTKQQAWGELPAAWDPTAHNVVFFTSSEDEFAAIGDDWINPLYATQSDGLRRIVADLTARNARVRCTVRMHPNQARLRNRQTDALRTLAGPRVTVVGPEERIDTYALLRAATVVATFGSTVGIEAVYWGKTSILLGPTFYQHLGAAQPVASHEDAVRALLDPPAPADRSRALPYGFWLQTHGQRFEHFTPSGLFSGTFKGRAIRAKKPWLWQRVGFRLLRACRRLQEGTLRYNECTA